MAQVQRATLPRCPGKGTSRVGALWVTCNTCYDEFRYTMFYQPPMTSSIISQILGLRCGRSQAT